MQPEPQVDNDEEEDNEDQNQINSSRSKIFHDIHRLVAVIFEIDRNGPVLESLLFSHQKLGKPFVCHQAIHVDESEKYILDHLGNPRSILRDEGQYREK
jgi:hypothetical protein